MQFEDPELQRVYERHFRCLRYEADCYLRTRMFMNGNIILGLLYLCCAISNNCVGRPVYTPTLQELWAEAELVAVIRPLSTTNAADQLHSAGPRYGPRNPSDYQAMNTRCEVVLVMKASESLQGGFTNGLTLLHFRYAPSLPEFNGGRFIYFDFAPTELAVIVKDGHGQPVCQDTPTYLAFLKRGRGGRFVPVTGHYDSEPSFRVLATPVGGAVRYAIQDGPRGNQQDEEDGTEPSSSETNRAPGVAVPPRAP